jgi:RimJ/RimL family protein N-acetyltransferase
MTGGPFVPASFEVPRELATGRLLLEPLGPEHNEADYAAWTSSIEHIRATPGFAEGSWPRELSLQENLDDLVAHARHFEERVGFTYTVLDPTDGEIVGCVYIYPARDGCHDALVRSWVRASRAELDTTLRQAVSDWLAAEWPFTRVDYTPRG